MVMRVRIFDAKPDRDRVQEQGFVSGGAFGAQVVAGLEHQLVSSRRHPALGQYRRIGAPVVVCEHLGKQNRRAPVQIIEPDQQAVGRNPARGVENMSGQVSLGHGYPAFQAAPFLCNRFGHCSSWPVH